MNCFPMANALYLAGTDTTRNQLNVPGSFAQHLNNLITLKQDLTSQAVEEVMRYLGAVREALRE